LSTASSEAFPETARQRILRVAARLYACRGYEGTSMREIAEAAAVTKPLVYYHFGSKEQLFSSLLRESLDRGRAVTEAVLRRDASAADRLHDLLHVQFELAREAPEVLAFMHEVMTMPGMLPLGFDYKSEGRQMCEGFVRLIEEGQERGEFRGVDPHTVVKIPIALLGWYVAEILSGALDSIPDGIEDTIHGLLLHGLEAKP
jgi:AcrR family transcriptional regulator